MKRAFFAAVFALAMTTIATAQSPLLSTVEPDNGKEGDEVSTKGSSLGKKFVGELYLTDGKHDIKVTILNQADEEIKFKVPKAGDGRYHLMVLTSDKSHFIEQPVVFTVGGQ